MPDMNGKKSQPPETKPAVVNPRVKAEPLVSDHSETLQANVIVHGRYDIIGKIGQGGMGEIFAARDRTTNEKVVIKFMIRAQCTDKDSEERFNTEAKAAAAIDHPNVIKIFDMDEFQGRPFMVVEFLSGMDLKDYLKATGPLPWDQMRPILLKMCDGIEAAHMVGVIHRDLKPQNVFMVDDNGVKKVKILDLGLAKFINTPTGVQTAVNVFAGTPEYAAPEMIKNKKDVGAWSDIYAMGIIMYEMATGVLPFTGDKKADDYSLQILRMQIDIPPIPPTVRRPDLGIPIEVEKIILKCMAKDWRSRYQSMAELRSAILACEGRTGMSEIAVSAGDVLLQGSLRTRIVRPKSDSKAIPAQMQAESEPPQAKGGWLKKTVVGTLIAGAIAAGVYFGYTNWNKMTSVYDEMRGRSSRVEGTSPDAKPSASAVPSKSASEKSTFMVNIESDPSGAYIYDSTPGRNSMLGKTPLHRELQKGEYQITVTLGRRSQKTTISPAHPEAKIVFQKGKQSGATVQPGTEAPPESQEKPDDAISPPETDNGADNGQ